MNSSTIFHSRRSEIQSSNDLWEGNLSISLDQWGRQGTWLNVKVNPSTAAFLYIYRFQQSKSSGPRAIKVYGILFTMYNISLLQLKVHSCNYKEIYDIETNLVDHLARWSIGCSFQKVEKRDTTLMSCTDKKLKIKRKYKKRCS